jgi:hypothetical protein
MSTRAPVGGQGPDWHRKLVVMMPTHAMVAIMILTSEKILEIHNPNAAKNRQLQMSGR